jgi:methylenetetrahydrofolate reductase (NADPH)
MSTTNAAAAGEAHSQSGVTVSFEFFPPKNEEMEEALWKCISRLEPVQPEFVSVTYGAGGSTRERTHATVSRIIKETSLKPAAHLTCVSAARDDVDEVVRAYWDAGVRHIVALRGDPPEGVGAAYVPHEKGYKNAADLVGGIKRIADFEISVAAYPEKHPESPNFATDLDMLKAKIDAGASRAITQFFFANDDFRRYRDLLQAHGIDVPVVPGILPVLNFRQVAGFAGRCGAHVPAWLADRFDGLDDDPETRRLIAASVAAEQVLDLMRDGVRQFHFYTMNRANLVYAICHLLGIRPPKQPGSKAAAA